MEVKEFYTDQLYILMGFFLEIIQPVSSMCPYSELDHCAMKKILLQRLPALGIL